MNTNLRRSIASLLIVSITGLGMPLPAQAGIVSTESAVAADRDRIATMLDRTDVRAQLEARGVNFSDAKARVAALTDEEVTQLAGRIDSLPAGSGNGGGALLFAIIVVMLAPLLKVLAAGTVVVLGIKAVEKGIAASSNQTSTDDSRTGVGQVAGVTVTH
jgi:hypothetical protein